MRLPRLLLAGLAERIASSRFGIGTVLDGRPGGSMGGSVESAPTVGTDPAVATISCYGPPCAAGATSLND